MKRIDFIGTVARHASVAGQSDKNYGKHRIGMITVETTTANLTEQLSGGP